MQIAMPRIECPTSKLLPMHLKVSEDDTVKLAVPRD